MLTARSTSTKRLAKDSEANKNIENTSSHGDANTPAATMPSSRRRVNSDASTITSSTGTRFK